MYITASKQSFSRWLSTNLTYFSNNTRTSFTNTIVRSLFIPKHPCTFGERDISGLIVVSQGIIIKRITRTKRPSRIEEPIYPTNIRINQGRNIPFGMGWERLVDMFAEYLAQSPPHPHPVCADKIKNRKEQHQQKQLKLARLVLLLLYPTRCLRNILLQGKAISILWNLIYWRMNTQPIWNVEGWMV